MQDLVIYGAGSVGRLAEQIIIDINKEQDRFNLLGFLDDDKTRHRTVQHGTPILGDIQWLAKHPGTSVVIGFSSTKQKQELHRRLKEFGHLHFATLIHPDTWIANRVDIGTGSIVYPGVHLDVDIRLGAFCLINKLSTIGHDTIIGDYSTVSPGVNIGGFNTIGRGVEFGINSCSVQRISIGDHATIGAGAVIIRDVEDNAVVVGNPGRVIRKN